MSPTRYRRAALLAVVALAGCSATAGHPVPETSAGPGTGPSVAPTTGPTTRPPARPPTGSSAGWELTVVYSAVEKFHTDKKVPVTGCPQLECSNGSDDLGRHPASFVKAVKEEGSGRLTDGRYLNWSYDVGYWLDTAPRNASGGSLVPFVSAAGDPAALPQGTRFSLADCGHIENSKAKPPAKVCDKLSAASWEVDDEFTPGSGGEHHVDLYIGEETQKHFENTPWYTTLRDATLTLQLAHAGAA